jgi:hypothetical protein
VTEDLLGAMNRLLTRTRVDLTKVVRWRTTAQTWFRNAVALLVAADEGTSNAEVKWLIGYESCQLLATVFSEADSLVPLLSACEPDQVEEIEQAAKDLARRIKRVRQAGMLANVTGRTPEETAEFERKAGDLRG